YGVSACRCSGRFASAPTDRFVGVGFRVVLPVADLRDSISRGQKPAVTTAISSKLRDPAFQKWIEYVAGMPAEEQVKAVAKKLQEHNKGFDGKVTPKVENGIVTELQFVTDKVMDISPVQALEKLKSLTCGGSKPSKGKLADLSPLKGMSLTQLNINNTEVADL